ncbi:MAG: membrane dipeptidase [candidate division WOR-3 bacterium]|nr:MAG: membrane dipeptidase [candidate division WOR-3 bacterium]
MQSVFDLHCDTPHNISKNKFNHIIPTKLHHQCYLGAVFAHFVYPRERYPFVEIIKLLSSTIAYIKKLKTAHIIHSFRELDKNKTNIILGVEGGHSFDNTFKQVEVFYQLGVRVFTLTWNNSNKLAHSALRADKKGLTKKGKKFLRELKNYNVILDLSHASTRTVLDVCEICENRVIASHSCVRSLHPSYLRNIDDRAIQAIADKGGVVGVNVSKHHLGDNSVVDHLQYLKDNFGLDIAAIGSDFDGVTDAVIDNPAGLKAVEKELFKKGYKTSDIEKIFSKNFLRVFKKATA